MPRGDKVPVFATSIDSIKYDGPSEDKDEETNMMDLRWRSFQFKHKIPSSQAVKVSRCGKCFAAMALLGNNFDE